VIKLSESVCLVLLVACAAMTAGCLVRETTHAVCLEPDGSASWTVLDRNVHATGDTAADRFREEEEYLAKARNGQGATAVALRAIGASEVTTQIVASRWPFAVLTEARFASVAGMLQACFDAAGGIRGQSVLQPMGDRTTWRIVVTQDEETTAVQASEIQDAIENLLAGVAGGDAEFFIRHGQFVEAVGFTITDDGRVAKLDDLSKWDWETRPRIQLSLTWTDEEAGRR
jgi:hypothetical protein